VWASLVLPQREGPAKVCQPEVPQCLLGQEEEVMDDINPLTLAAALEQLCRNHQVDQLELARLHKENSELKAEVETLKGQRPADKLRFASGWYWIKRPFDPCATIVSVKDGVCRFGNGDETTVDKANLDGKTKWFGPMASPSALGD
jgi:hypothetical protein